MVDLMIAITVVWTVVGLVCLVYRVDEMIWWGQRIGVEILVVSIVFAAMGPVAWYIVSTDL